MPIGAGLGGLVAEWLGVRAVFLLTGGLVIALILPLALVVTDDAIADAEALADSG